jgi:hypothetical protein
MSIVECQCCGVWVDSDDTIGGALDKDAPFGWKCERCLIDDREKADENGYRVPDQEALDEAAEAAWERRQAADLECPPVTMDEQHMLAWKQKQGLR